ncbi:MAG: hypothetical protein GY838_12295 [bacterium]|nr:hypothetical protein [bacterium]
MDRRGHGGGQLLLLAIVAFMAPSAPAAAQAPGDDAPPVDLPLEQEFHVVPAGTAPLQLAHGRVSPDSLRVNVDGRSWVRDTDYRLRARSGVVVPLRPWRVTTSAEPGDDRAVVVVTYRFQPIPLVSRLDLRTVVAAPPRAALDDGTGSSVRSSTALAARTDNLQVTGSKTVQVASGSRRELTVDQNLRLNIAGQLTEDIAVRAFLSDDNLPVIPEGNTEELRDIDKVFVELRSRRWGATLGDFVAERGGSRFGRYRRKLQGVAARANPDGGRAEVLAGSPRGIYRTLQIRGQESNQGPYFLAGTSAGGNLFVVAGSERVTMDGQPLTRGADRDYIIDYVQGSITFTYRRLITAETTIVVEFEEGEGPYGRTVVGGGGGADFTLPIRGLIGALDVRVIRERDDPKRLRTGELAEEDEAVLAAAGDDPLRAVADGVTATLSGEGDYRLDAGSGPGVYVFEEGGADYAVVFYYAGPGLGNYTLERVTTTGTRVYVHVGTGGGSYRIGRPLDLPESRTVMTMTASLGDTAGAHLAAEWDVSSHDRNLVSKVDDHDNSGQAAAVNVALPGRHVGRGVLDLAAFYQTRAAAFRGFEPDRNVFDYDDWGLADRARRPGFLAEGDREAGAQLGWRTGSEGRRLAVGGRLGTLEHGLATTAERRSANGEWTMAGGHGRHGWLRARADDATDPLDSERVTTEHHLDWRLGPVVPEGGYRLQRWEDAAMLGARAAGFRHEEWSGGLSGAPGGPLAWRAGFKRGRADSLRAGVWQEERDTRTTTASITTGRFAGMRLVGEGTLRRIVRPGGDDETTRLARANLSGAWERTASDWSLGYRVDNSRSVVRDRQVVFVGEGLGDYDRDGNYVGPEQGDHDLVLAATDSLLATTAVQTDLQWRQGFDFLGSERWYGAWSFLTVAQAEGRSTTEEVGRLLVLDPAVLFDRESAVLGDLTWRQELTLLEHLKSVDLRGVWNFRQTRDRQYATHPEDRYTRNLQVNGNVSLSRRSSLRLRWVREDERRFTEEGATSSRRSYTSLLQRYETAWNWRPMPDLRLSLQGEYVTRDDAVSTVEQTEFALRPSGRHRFAGAWSVQADLRWAEVESQESAGTVRPWFYPEAGANVESTLRLAWDPTRFLAVSASWFSRKQGERRWQHDVRLESTARF